MFERPEDSLVTRQVHYYTYAVRFSGFTFYVTRVHGHLDGKKID